MKLVDGTAMCVAVVVDFVMQEYEADVANLKIASLSRR